MAQTYVAITSPGLEEQLLQELRGMKIKRPKVIEGGVEFEATSRGLYEVLLWSRVAHRVMWRVDDFRARDQRECYKKSRRVEWERMLGEGAQVAIRGVVKESYIYGSGALVSSVADGMRDRYAFDVGGLRGPTIDQTGRAINDPGIFSLLARCDQDRCTLSLEGSSGSMHRRGWRTQTGGAPLRESIASAILRAVAWTPDQPLLDPMCGSGTILVEAARQALGKLPRLTSHHYGVRDWANFDEERFEAMHTLVAKHAVKPEVLRLFGRDRDEAVLDLARANLKRAEVADVINLAHIELVDGVAPCEQPGWIVSNPPYGERLSDAGVMRELGESLREHFQGWKVAMLVTESQRPPRVGTPWEARLSLKNGGIPVKLMVSEVK